MPGSKSERRHGQEVAAHEVGDRHGLAEGTAEADERGADDPAEGVAQADLAQHLPGRRTHPVAGLLGHTRDHEQDVAREGGDEREDHDRQDEAGGQDREAAALKGVAGAQEGQLAQPALGDRRRHAFLHERHEHEETPHAEDDARDRGEHLDRGAQHARRPRRHELREQQGDDERERNGDDHGDERRQGRTGERRERAVTAAARRPRDGGQEAQAELPDRRPGVVDEDPGQRDHGDADREAAGQRDDPEGRVAEAATARRRLGGAARWSCLSLRVDLERAHVATSVRMPSLPDRTGQSGQTGSPPAVMLDSHMLSTCA